MSGAWLLDFNQWARHNHQLAQDARDSALPDEDRKTWADTFEKHRDALLDRAATAVMETGEPGGHDSQHDLGCHLSRCDQVDSFDLGGMHRCAHLPGCGWPDTAGEVGAP